MHNARPRVRYARIVVIRACRTVFGSVVAAATVVAGRAVQPVRVLLNFRPADDAAAAAPLDGGFFGRTLSCRVTAGRVFSPRARAECDVRRSTRSNGFRVLFSGENDKRSVDVTERCRQESRKREKNVIGALRTRVYEIEKRSAATR